MVHLTRDTYPVSDFNRKPAEHIKRVQDSKKPEVLTVNGKAALVVMDPGSYDQLSKQAELSRSLEQILRATAEHQSGSSQPLHQALADLKDELKARKPDASL